MENYVYGLELCVGYLTSKGLMLGQATMVKCIFHMCLYVEKGYVCIVCGNGHRTALKSSAPYCKSCQRYNFCLAILKLRAQFWIPYGEKNMLSFLFNNLPLPCSLVFMVPVACALFPQRRYPSLFCPFIPPDCPIQF